MEQLLARHFGYVHNLCRRILADAADAEDARQDALILASQRISTFDGRSSFGTWLHTLTRNVCLNAIRSSSRRPSPVEDVERPQRDWGEPGPNEGRHRGRGPALHPQEGVAQRLDIDAALAAVTPVHRDVLVLRLHYDLEYQQIADTLQIPLNTVRSRLRRGRDELVSLLGELEGPSAGSDQSEAPNRNRQHSERGDAFGEKVTGGSG